ncbi:MAG: VWA domain-containing protein [Crocinitomicaceae bacterium]|nr:VWA domain-containing protein [Crocinitomicaceae bacterium]
MKKISFIFVFLFSISFSWSQEKLTRILFVLDASNSMNAKWDGNQTRLEAAKELLSKAVDSLKGTANLELALRVYGHQTLVTATYQDCSDTKLEIPFGPNQYDAIKFRIRGLQAKGTTPIARSLEASAGDFPDMNSRNIIILITDGLEACDGDPCVIAKKLKDKNINVTPFVIGLGLDLSYLDKFRCIGEYSEAETKTQFDKVLNKIINKSLTNSTTQINLNNIVGKPLETDVTLFLYEAGTTKIKYTFMHTLNDKGNPDTLNINTIYKYDMLVNTIPPVWKKNIEIYKNKHNVIEADVPQGFLKVKTATTSRFVIDTRIMQSGSGTTLNVQQINSTDKYIVGKYDLEILTLPRIYQTIEINQSALTNIDVPVPGILNYKTSAPIAGQIFVAKENGTWEWVCNLDNTTLSGTWILLPGTYKIVYRQLRLKSTDYTYEKEFKIFSNRTMSVNI